jgi:hypothetical protein
MSGITWAERDEEMIIPYMVRLRSITIHLGHFTQHDRILLAESVSPVLRFSDVRYESLLDVIHVLSHYRCWH